jgi:excisionase family DNA binding protein
VSPDVVLNEDGSLWLSPQAAERVRLTLGPVWRAHAARNGAWPRWQLDLLRALDQRVVWADMLSNVGLPFAEPSNTSAETIEVSAREAAAALKCSERWVRELASSSRIPARRVGRQWLITLHREDIPA